jgi:hypothetical protein
MFARSLSAVLLISLTSLASAFAGEPARWELKGGANASFAYESNVGPSGGNGSNDVLINLDGVYGIFMTPNWELPLSLHTRILTGNSASVVVTPMVGLAYNFSEDTTNSFYLGARVGPSFQYFNSGAARGYTLFSYESFIGKRIVITDHISWAPEVSFGGHASGSTTDANGSARLYDSSTHWTITPVQFALLF